MVNNGLLVARLMGETALICHQKILFNTLVIQLMNVAPSTTEGIRRVLIAQVNCSVLIAHP